MTYLKSLYDEKKYLEVINLIGGINLESLDEGKIILLIKSIIHTYSEEEEITKDLLFLALTKTKHIHFHGLGTFHILLNASQIEHVINDKEKIWNWNTLIQIEAGDFRYIRENVERLQRKYIISNPTRDNICLFFLSCLELYNLDSDYYPLYKWLFNLHFKIHD